MHGRKKHVPPKIVLAFWQNLTFPPDLFGGIFDDILKGDSGLFGRFLKVLWEIVRGILLACGSKHRQKPKHFQCFGVAERLAENRSKFVSWTSALSFGGDYWSKIIAGNGNNRCGGLVRIVPQDLVQTDHNRPRNNQKVTGILFSSVYVSIASANLLGLVRNFQESTCRIATLHHGNGPMCIFF